jgi:hypothetical protein
MTIDAVNISQCYINVIIAHERVIAPEKYWILSEDIAGFCKPILLCSISTSLSYINKKNIQMMTATLKTVNHHFVTYRYLRERSAVGFGVYMSFLHLFFSRFDESAEGFVLLSFIQV